MIAPRSTPEVAFLVLALPLVGDVATAQAESQADDARVLERVRTMLEQRPTHAALFDRYFKLLVDANAIEAEIEALRARVARDPESSLPVLLGRLLLRAGKEDDALIVLEGVRTADEEVQVVVGDIYFKLARFDAAARAFRAALPAARTAEHKRTLYEKIGRAELALGQKDAALATWGRIAELDGGKFFRRLEVAELLAGAGLLDEAAAAYEPLLAESAGDPPRHCQVLRDLGHLQELEGRLDAALATYDRVLTLTGRGNWLRKEVEKRVIQIHRRTGRLGDLVTRLRAQLAEDGADLATSELLASVLLDMRQLDAATEILASVSQRYPTDVRLARRVAELHVERGDIAAAIAEYQRILDERPEELELYLELGTLFARGERFAEAKLQWERALAKNLDDATLCARLAAMYALWDRTDDAIRLYERAIELEPDTMVRYIDLGDYLFAQKRRDAAIAILDRALERAGREPRRLEALLGTLRENDLLDRAERALATMLEVEPANDEARYALADLWLTRGNVAAARPLLWQVAESVGGADGHRVLAANTLVSLAGREPGGIDVLIREAGARDSAGARFVLGRAHTRNRDFVAAVRAYRDAIALQPADLESRRLLARLLAEEGDHGGALAEYEQIAVVAPGERRQHFAEVARLHLERYDLDAAIATWQQAMRDNPDNAAVFVQVGREFQSVQRGAEALEAFRHASRLRPTDPEVALRFAEALSQAGRSDEAEEQLTRVATNAADSRDREQARARLFDLFAEQGRLDARIDALQARIAENPYDVDAPQLLADVYRRTGDFVLGLEMVDRVLRFQPRNRELLTRRAELLESLDEWEDAIAVHEELLKFPDADRDLHLTGIGRAQFELGRSVDAKATFRKIDDRGRVRALYAQYHLHDEAVDYYRRAIARDPSDLRSHLYLAEELEKLMQRDAAIEVLERALNLRPFFREALELVGKLYVQADRRDDAIAAGMRLFGLRGEEVERSRREEQEAEDAERRSRWRTAGTQPFSQRRLQAAQSYFTARGLRAEWGRILVAEARRRPTDVALYQAVQQHYQWSERSAGKFFDFVSELLAADFDELRVPPGFTPRSYREKLESDRLAVYEHDASVAERRLAELSGRELSAPELRERARAQRALGRLDAARDDLEACVRRDADDVVARTLLVEIATERKDYGAAYPHVERTLEWWDGPGAAFAPELEARREQEFVSARKSLLDALPRRIRRRADDATLRAVLERTRGAEPDRLTSLGFPESVPSRAACALRLVRLAAALGDRSRIDDAVRRAQRAAATLAERSALGNVLFQEGLHAPAEETLRAVVAEADALRADPIQVYFWPRYQPSVGAAAAPLGELLLRKGEWLAAHRVLRGNGEAAKAELLLRQSDGAASIQEALAREVTARGEALVAARADGLADVATLELDYRDAVIQRADALLGAKDLTAAETVYRTSLALLPDDLDIRVAIAALCDRRGDVDASIAMHDEIIEVKRRRRRAAGADAAVPPNRLQPTLPGESNRQYEMSSSFAPFSTYSGGVMSPSRVVTHYGGHSGDRFDVAEDYLAILQKHMARNRPDDVLATLQRLVVEDPATFRNMSWKVLDAVRNQDLGKRRLPVLRILRGAVDDDEWLTLEYARACRDEGELQEARRTLEKAIARQLGAGGNAATAEAELARVLQRLGEPEVGVPGLRAAVEREPDNVRHRLRLAQRLAKDHDYAAALEQARAIVERAPYLTEAKELVVNAAAACGDDTTAIAVQRQLFDEATNPSDKLRRGVNLANWLWASGASDEACAIVDRLEIDSGGSQSFSPGNWFLDKGRTAAALDHYRRELERNRSQSYRIDSLRQRIVRLSFATGDARGAIASLLEAIEEAGSLPDRESRFRELLRAVKGHPRPRELASVIRDEYAGATSASARLGLAAAEFAVGAVEPAVAHLEAAIAESPKEVYLYPLLLGLRRLAGDHAGALARLDEMTRVYGGSDTMQWTAGAALRERDRLALLRADLLEEAGRFAEADALIAAIADETDPASFERLSQILRQRGRPADALHALQRYHRKLGTRAREHLVAEAALLVEMDRFDEALPLVEEALIMAPDDSQTRDLLVQVHGGTDSLPALVARFAGDFAKDPRDESLRATLVELYGALRRPDATRALWERMLADEDQREPALEALATLAGERGEHRLQLEYLERRLPLTAGESAKALRRQIASVLVTLGDVDRAIEQYARSLDLETADGKISLGRWLQQRERHEAAYAEFVEARRLDSDSATVALPLAEAAWRTGRAGEAIDAVVWRIRDQRGVRPALDVQLRTILCDAIAALDDAARERILRAPEDTVEARERAALAHAARGDFALALDHADAALARRADSGIALEIRWLALSELDRDAELASAADALRTALEREFLVAGNWSFHNRAQELQNEIGRVLWRLGDAAGAQAAWRAAPVRRTPYSNPFSFWRSDWGVRYAAESWLGVREPQRALAALDEEFLLRESAPWSVLTQALDRVGRLDEVEELAWQRFLDPLELYGVATDSYGWVWIGGEYRRASGMQEFLVEFYRKRGELDELRARGEELLAAPATRRQAELLLQAIAVAAGDQRALAQQLERELATTASVTPDRLHDLAVRWLEAGDVERALAAMRECLDFERPALDRWVRRRDPGGPSPAAVAAAIARRNPFEFTFSGGYSTWFPGSRDGDLETHRRTAAAVLWRSGDDERAARLEHDLLEQPTATLRRKGLEELARVYQNHGLAGRAIVLWRELLESPREEFDDKACSRVLAEATASLAASGDSAGLAEFVALRRAELERRITAEPGPHAFALRAELAALLVRYSDDVAAGLEQLALLRRHMPSERGWLLLEAEGLIRLGEPRAGIERLARLRELRIRAGEDDTVAEQAWLGIGTVRGGDVTAGRELLAGVLQRLPAKSELRRLVRDALEGR